MVSFRNPLAPWKAKISRIDDLMLLDCTPNALALIAGTAVAVFNIFWSVAGPDCIDAAWDNRSRAKGPHRKQNLKGNQYAPVGLPLPPGQFGIHIDRIGALAQKIGFAFAVVDGFLEGVYYGSTMARRYSGCPNPGQGYAQLGMENAVPELIPATDGIISSWNVLGTNGLFAGPAFVDIPPGFTDYVTVVASMHQGFNEFPPIADCSYTLGVYDDTGRQPIPLGWAGITRALSPYATGAAKDYYLGFHSARIGVSFTKTAGVMFITQGNFLVQCGKIQSPFDFYKCGAKATSHD